MLCDFLARVSLKHKFKMTVDWCVFKFIRGSVDGKRLMRFQSDTSVVKFLQRSMAGNLVACSRLSVVEDERKQGQEKKMREE